MFASEMFAVAVGEEEKAAIAEAVRKLVDVKRNGVELSDDMKEAVVDMFAGSAKKVGDIKQWTAEMIGGVGADAYRATHKKEAPPYETTILRTWAADTKLIGTAADDDHLFAALGAGGGGGEGGADMLMLEEKMRELAVLREQLEEQIREQKGQSPDITIGWKKKLRHDTEETGLSATEITALDCSLETGGAIPSHTIADVAYGTGASMVQPVKDHRKGGGSTLSMMLKETPTLSGKRKIVTHLTSLARVYAEEGQPIEASLVQCWSTEAQEAFQNDTKGFFTYLEDYRRTYAGRAIAPCTFDQRIAARSKHDEDGPSRDELKKVQAQIASALSQLESLKAENAKLKKEVQSFRNNGPRGGGGDFVDPRVKCFKCGETGHKAANCPHADA